MKITAVGDIALTRTVESRYEARGAAVIESGLRSRLAASELLIANIECPLTDNAKSAWEHFATIKASRKTADLLSDIGVKVGSLANNHISDYGSEGLRDTVAALEKRKIRWLGAGRNHEEALCPLVFRHNGVRVGMIAAAQPEVSAAGAHHGGAAVLSERRLKGAVKRLSARVDVTIVLLHFGIEFCEYPTPRQVDLCRSLVDRGALLVFGHHPHVPQAFEHYKGGFIAYSLGNFIFDMSAGPHRFSRLGLMVEAELKGKSLARVDIHPVDTRSGFPVLLNGKKLLEANRHLGELNRVLVDSRLLQEKYYFACRDNLIVHLKALFNYGVRRMNFRRILTWTQSQFWPQILELRIDLARFLFSGKAATFEVQKKRHRHNSVTRVWLFFCRVAGSLGNFNFPRR
jgi:poly-gamma-glutamate synthesis protein (capsule biosynthesis protein)